jgi:DNA processing protein
MALHDGDIETAWVALSLLKHVGSKTIRALLTHFDDDLMAVLNADTRSLCAVPGVGRKIAAAIHTIDLEMTARAMQRWRAAGVEILPMNHPAYPTFLRGLDDAPATLFLRGAWRWTNTEPGAFKAAALIGTRTPSLQARITARRLAGYFVRQGYVVVSGLAIGIDAQAHTATLEYNGMTLAVLGNGVLNPYPPENLALAADILQRGALLCEVHPDAPVSAAGLVARNRIITGLCERVIVVETESDGGAMHAARFALNQGRQVYAADLPASGNRWLLANGAKSASSFLEEHL